MGKHKFYINIFQNIILIEFFVISQHTHSLHSPFMLSTFLVVTSTAKKKKLKRRVQCVLLLYLLEQRQTPSGSPLKKTESTLPLPEAIN